LCGERAAGKGIVISVPDIPAWTIHAVPSLFEQALINIVDNAVIYSPAHTTITISAQQLNGRVEVAVADEGPGISPEHIGRIFERFYRVDKARSRKIGGTGLGLAIVKHIMMVLGGAVSVESTPARGSVFTLSIPSGDSESPNR